MNDDKKKEVEYEGDELVGVTLPHLVELLTSPNNMFGAYSHSAHFHLSFHTAHTTHTHVHAFPPWVFPSFPFSLLVFLVAACIAIKEKRTTFNSHFLQPRTCWSLAFLLMSRSPRAKDFSTPLP